MGNCHCMANHSEALMIRNSTHPALKRNLESYSTSGIEDIMASPQHSNIECRRSLTDFEIVKKIGEGSFGIVHLVNCALDKKQYAMKVILKSNAQEPRAKQMSIVEKNILAANDHPFLLKLYYAFQDEYKLYLITDYVEGSDLSKNMKYKKNYCESEVIFYCSEILLALENLHFRGIIYRDLKPENILLTKEGHIKLSDFGLSTIKKTPNEKRSSTVGTLNYIAPEIVLGQDGHNEQADIWSFGMIIYELFHGQPAFFSRDKKKQIDSCINKEIQINPKISAEAHDLIRKLLQVDPDLRLGKNGIEEIKQHPFFRSVDWDKVERGETTGPKPICKTTLNKEMEYLNKRKLSTETNSPPLSPSNYIPGFSYNYTMSTQYSQRFSQDDLLLQHSKNKFE